MPLSMEERKEHRLEGEGSGGLQPQAEAAEATL